MFDPIGIKWLQTALDVLGANPPLDVDGEYGPITKDAVMASKRLTMSWPTVGRPNHTQHSNLRLPKSQASATVNRRATVRKMTYLPTVDRCRAWKG